MGSMVNVMGVNIGRTAGGIFHQSRHRQRLQTFNPSAWHAGNRRHSNKFTTVPAHWFPSPHRDALFTSLARRHNCIILSRQGGRQGIESPPVLADVGRRPLPKDEFCRRQSKVTWLKDVTTGLSSRQHTSAAARSPI